MLDLTDGQKLKITRLGKCMTLEDVAKLVVLSPSHISYIEHGSREMPEDVKNLIDLDEGTDWYQKIFTSLPDEHKQEVMMKLNSILGIIR